MTISEFNKKIIPAIILGIIYSCIEISLSSHIVKPFTYFFVTYLIVAEIVFLPVEGEDFLYAKKSFLVKKYYCIIVSLFYFLLFLNMDTRIFKIIGLINTIFLYSQILVLEYTEGKVRCET